MSERAPIITVTGTGTAIGKPVATAAIVVGLRAQGFRPAVAKSTQTGLLPGEPRNLHDVCRWRARHPSPGAAGSNLSPTAAGP